MINALYESIPTGVGGKKKRFLKKDHINEVLSKGTVWALEQGYITEEDIENWEDNGCVSYSDPSVVSIRARQRCFEQLGSLGLSGNHYVEIQTVDEIFDEEIANIMF